MGRQLYETQPTFRRALDECDALLKPHLERSLLSVLYPAEGETLADRRDGLHAAALFAFEYALAQLWRSWGIEPALVLGHSVGEYVAACVAGVMTLEEGLKLIAARGRLMQALPAGGQMAAVFASPERVEAAIAAYADRVSIAAYNGPQNVVISGDGPAVQEILAALEKEGIKATRLSVSHAFHSPLMEPMLDEFASVRPGRSSISRPSCAVISQPHGPVGRRRSARIGRLLARARAAAGAVRPLDRDACRTRHRAVAGDRSQSHAVGHGPPLCGVQPQAIQYPSLAASGPRRLADAAGEPGDACTSNGVEVDWAGFDRDYQRRKVWLPTYPFQRQRYWLETAPSPVEPKSGRRRPRLAIRCWARSSAARSKDTIFESQLSTSQLPYLADHRVYDHVDPAGGRLPGDGPGGRLAGAGQPARRAGEGADQRAAVRLRRADDGAGDRLARRRGGDVHDREPGFKGGQDAWTVHATGQCSRLAPRERVARARKSRPSKHAAGVASPRAPTTSVCTSRACSTVRGSRESKSCRAATAKPSASCGLASPGNAEYRLHPALLDACFQLLGAAVPCRHAGPHGLRAGGPGATGSLHRHAARGRGDLRLPGDDARRAAAARRRCSAATCGCWIDKAGCWPRSAA